MCHASQISGHGPKFEEENCAMRTFCAEPEGLRVGGQKGDAGRASDLNVDSINMQGHNEMGEAKAERCRKSIHAGRGRAGG